MTTNYIKVNYLLLYIQIWGTTGYFFSEYNKPYKSQITRLSLLQAWENGKLHIGICKQYNKQWRSWMMHWTGGNLLQGRDMRNNRSTDSQPSLGSMKKGIIFKAINRTSIIRISEQQVTNLRSNREPDWMQESNIWYFCTIFVGRFCKRFPFQQHVNNLQWHEQHLIIEQLFI